MNVPTHVWNPLLAHTLLNHRAHAPGRLLTVAVSLAGEDGVYDLDDLAQLLGDGPALHDPLGRVLQSLVVRDGVWDLNDLRLELRRRIKEPALVPA